MIRAPPGLQLPDTRFPYPALSRSLKPETQQYLDRDPGGLLERAANVGDPTIAGGTVTQQNIGYLWPMGPYFWLAERLGTPDWLASRVLIGSILFAASLGAPVLIRLLLVRHPVPGGVPLAYGLSPDGLGPLTAQPALQARNSHVEATRGSR